MSLSWPTVPGAVQAPSIMGNALLLVLARPSIIVVGVPDCWVDSHRLNQWLRRSPANDNGRPSRS